MNNNIEVMKSVWRRMERPSAVKLRRIKAKAELEARVTLRYMALLSAVLTKRNNIACTEMSSQ